MPPEARAGRLLRVEGDRLLLHREGRELVAAAKAGAVPLSVLSPGDLVAVDENGQWTLLAPALARLDRTFDEALLKKWSAYLGFVREFFHARQFIEVRTPALVECPGTEPALDVFKTEFTHGSKKKTFFLPTSPELHLKKALALGGERIFEIANCFRNGEITERHQPEFLMLEWYRAFDHLGTIQSDVQQMVVFLAEKLQLKRPDAFRSVTIAELFKKHANYDLKPTTSFADYKQMADNLKLDTRNLTTVDDLFSLIMIEKIEPNLPPNEATFVHDYPPFQAALARTTKEGWGDRFELYWKNLELANAFHELNDPTVQRKRFEEDLQKKRDWKKEEVPLDEEFLKALEAGMPPSAGVALGLERLFMALTSEPNLKTLRLFPLEN